MYQFYQKQLYQSFLLFQIAIFRAMIITEGTANPKAQGHDATKIEIALSKGKHQTQN